MKTFFRNTTAICLAFIVLFSTTSFAINEHYCGDTLVASALFTKAKACNMEMQNAVPDEKMSIFKDACCKDVVKLVEGQNDLKLDFSNLDFQQQLYIVTFVYSYFNLFESIEKETIPFKYYTPPLIVKDIHVLDNIFLI